MNRSGESTSGTSTNPATVVHTGQSDGDITLKLNTKGSYTWSIKLPVILTDGRPNFEVIKQLADIDSLLQTTFPNHASKTRTRTVNF